jgi:DNA (cytosine-5)-methyltransferase 1
MLNGLSLFTGIGGLDVALSEYVRPIAYCEIDSYCQAVLLSRISDGSLHNTPIWDEIKSLSYDGRNWPEIDIIYGGFPCQEISIAGNGKGLEGERSGLFFEIVRLAKEIKPCFIFLENVPAITKRGGIQVVGSLAKMGYDCRWCVTSAASIGAVHKRERFFLLAHSKSERFQEERLSLREEKTQPRPNHNIKHETSNQRTESPSPFYRVDDDISFRVDRTKTLGNAVCIEQAKKAFKILMGIEKNGM